MYEFIGALSHTSKIFEHPKQPLGGLAKKCPTRLALRTAKKTAPQTPARNFSSVDAPHRLPKERAKKPKPAAQHEQNV
jgi:hypothetical protein